MSHDVAQGEEAPLAPYALRCEQLRTPTAIDEPAPRFSWRLRGGARGGAQSAYRLRVVEVPPGEGPTDRSTAPREGGSGRTSEALPGSLVWDSGRREAEHGILVPYAGPDLRPTTHYAWQVDVWDEFGEPAGSERSWFETGLMVSDAWGAVWIARDRRPRAAFQPPRDDHRTFVTRHFDPCVHLRRTFEVETAPVRARLHCTARGVYQATVNGHRVGDHELEPGWTDYGHRVVYRSYDVTQHLQAGTNTVGALLGDGWWAGFVGFDPRRGGKLYGDAAAFLAELHLTLADGTVQRITTDDRWKESDGALWYSDLLMGEYFRSSEARIGWDRPDFDDSTWDQAVEVDDDTSLVTAATLDPVRVTASLPSERIITRSDGRVIVDFGQNVVGRVRLTVRGADEGQVVVLRHGEALDDDGALYVDNLRRAEARDVAVCSGASAQTFEPTFTFHGFRYVEIDGYPGEPAPEDVVAQVLGTDLEPTGGFSCAHEDVERLAANIFWSQRGNFLSIPTDCPQRDERLGWLADAQVFLPTAARTMDVSTFLASWMVDVLHGQDEDGAFPDVAPKVCLPFEGAPAWGDGGVIIPWHLYRLYGDQRLLERCFPAMRRWVDRIERNNPDLIWRHHTGRNYGDWLEVEAATPRELVATAYFARSAQLVAATARVLGDNEAEGRYRHLADAVATTFVREFVGQDGRVGGDTQTGYLLALSFGLLPSHDADVRSFSHLVRDIERRDCRLTTGFVGVALICPVLTRFGRPDLAYRLLLQRAFPSWLFTIDNGATTIWERWDGWTPARGFQSANMNSFNHYSLGSVGDWLYGSVGGLRQAEGSVAYDELVVAPAPGPLRRASVWQETPRGRAEVSWTSEGEQFDLHVTVPPGVTATVDIPRADQAEVVESGVPVGEADGVDVLSAGSAEVRCRVTSGRYWFSTLQGGGRRSDHQDQ